MNYRNTIIVVGVLLVLVVVAFFLLNNNPTPSTNPTDAKVWDYGADTVTDVVLAQSNGKHTELLYKDSTWQVISGTQLLPADASIVQPIVNLLPKLQGQLVKDNATNLADYGLQPSRASMTMTLQSGKIVGLLIGDQVVGSQSQFYVADTSKPNKVLYNSDNTISTLVTWVNSPPVQQPTPTPAPPPPTTAPITGTNTLSGTGTLTGTNPITSTGSTAPGTSTLTTTNTLTNSGSVSTTNVMSSTMITSTNPITGSTPITP